jgi:hypothetical protein
MGVSSVDAKAEDDAIVEWANNTSELAKLKVYRFLNACGMRMAGIDQKIADEQRKQAPS